MITLTKSLPVASPVHFLSLQVCRLTRLLETSSFSSSSTSSSQLAARLSSLRTTLASTLPPRVLLPTLSRCYSTMVLEKKVRNLVWFWTQFWVFQNI